ncbi:MAG: hypothetical protein ACN6OB_04920 [Chryseobacterium jejuense]|uniref:hypothetical protein n=1 Tax=Chryseobacterium jejuense TaxID=445960 RepID=UPI003D0AF06E
MKKEFNVPMTPLEIEKLLVTGHKLSKLGNDLSKSLSKMSIPFENLKRCKIDISGISTKTGANYQGFNIRINEDLEFTPTWKARLVIDNDD